MGYQLIDHTADLGIEVREPDGPRLFTSSALAMTALICDPAEVHGTRYADLEVSGEDWPDLMVNWLRELLYFWTGREALIRTVNLKAFSAYTLTARVAWEPYSPDRHAIRHEIKAVTYHQIAAGPLPAGEVDGAGDPIEGWRARIIFDL